MTQFQRKGTFMNAKQLLAATAILSLPLGDVIAQGAPPEEHLFRKGEASLDLFGSVSVGQETLNNFSNRRVRDNGRLGLGLGGNYFFTRNLGLGADAYTENTQHSFVDNGSANLIFRVPLDEIRLAPYAFGGGGRQFDPTELWFAQLGAGLEFRFTDGLGLFADGRYVFTDETRNFGLGRLGLRCSF
jgi:hypothetical protein